VGTNGQNESAAKKHLPIADQEGSGPGRPMTPLQAEVMEGGTVPDPDVLGQALHRVDLAPEAGYGEDGPEPLPAPGDPDPRGRWEGSLPVFQWEVDPMDPSLETGEEHFAEDGWEYDVWWQRHPADLVYVSIQAMFDDPARGPERQHRVGRNVVVNMVWDDRRRGLIAIYGTARDFRPFVHAFQKAFGIEEPAEEDTE